MDITSVGYDTLSSVREYLKKARCGSHRGDVRGIVGYLLAILTENNLTLEAAGTDQQELASLVRFGLLNEAIAYLENAKTAEITGLGMKEIHIVGALQMAELAADTGVGSEAQAVADLMSIFGDAEAFVEAMSPDTKGPSGNTEPVEAISDEHTVAAFSEIDPFIQASVLEEQGDPTIQFLALGQSLPPQEELDLRLPTMEVTEDEVEVVDKGYVGRCRCSTPPPLPSRRQEAESAASS